MIGGWSNTNKNKIMDLLYDEEKGLGFNIARYNIGGGENPEHDHMRTGGQIEGFKPSPDTWNWEADQNQRWVLQAAKERGANILEAFSNSPPYWMTKSGCTAGKGAKPIFGVNNLKDDSYEDFADYLTEVVKHFKDEWGIEFRTLSPINEPISPAWCYEGGQEGCHWDRDKQNFIIKEVGKKIAQKGIETTVSGPEENTINQNIDSYGSYDSEAKGYISQINAHTYAGDKRRELLNAAKTDGKRLWMSEYGCGGDWREQGSHDHNEMKWALRLSETITKDLGEMESGAWIYWQAVEGEEGAVEGKHGWGLIHATFTQGQEDYWMTKQYYAMGNYSKFIRPGYTIIDTNNPNVLAAYDKDGGNLVFVVTNNSSKEVTHTFDISDFNNTDSVAKVYRTSQSENLDNISDVEIKDNTLIAKETPYSVTTYVINNAVYDDRLIKVNDTQIGIGLNEFNYSGNWKYGSQKGTYLNDNHWSDKSNDSYTIKFNGTQAKVYGSQYISHGIVAFSIDDGPEIEYDSYSGTRKDNVLMYTSPVLPLGEHTLKVRVTGKKGPVSTGCTVTADKVEIINYVSSEDNDIAVGKPVTCSSEQAWKGNGSHNGNDGNLSTKWCAENTNPGNWWKVDLGGLYSITGSQVMWEFDQRLYKYKIEVSADNTYWITAVDKTGNTELSQVQKDSFNMDNVRYVRITITGTEKRCWPSFYDFKVFGNAKDTTNPNIPPNKLELNFNTNWLYCNMDIPNGQDIDLDETRFEGVCLPHTNATLEDHQNIDISQNQFVSWYRRHFILPDEYKGRKVFVDFEGVGTIAQVYVNGKFVGEHKGAYTPFKLDITSYANFGDKENVIAVRVDSTERKDIPPEAGTIDYFLFGGISRDVKMILTDTLYSEGVFLTTPIISKDKAVVKARTNVVNDSKDKKSFKLVTNVVDKNNKVVAKVSNTETIDANSSKEIDQFTTEIKNPNLWHPDNPNLYKVYTQIIDENGIVDQNITKIGLRWFEFNKNNGKFYINGEPMKLIGLNRHETYPYIGRAAPNRLQARDADILKFEMGCNAVRSSHYPPDTEFLNRCDEIGLLAIEEIPGWQNIGDSAWQDIAINNVEEMIMRDRNHPSIIAWGVRINESIDNHDFYTKTNNKARSLDGTRPTIGVRFTANYYSEFLEDVFGFNDFTGGIKKPRQLPWLVTEYEGHMYPVKSFDKEERLVNQVLRHAKVQNESFAREDVAGALGWCGFDYNTPLSDNQVRYHGAYDMFRMPKFVTSVYRSQQDPENYEPMVFIANYWKKDSPKDVTIASNCEEVELFVNGVSKGIAKPNLYTSLPHPLFQFKNIYYEPGEIRAEGRIGGRVVASHVRHTPGEPVKLVLSTKDPSITADGSDMTMINVSAVDSYGQIVPLAGNKVKFNIIGSGKFIGENVFQLEDGKGGFFVQSKLGQAGVVRCTASSEGLEDAVLDISIEDMNDMVVPAIPRKPDAKPVAGENVALNRPAFSDSNEFGKGNGSFRANDGDENTRWCANDSKPNHYIMIDLGRSVNISSTEVTWEKDGKAYGYTIEASEDGNNWTTIVDKRNNGSKMKVQKDSFEALNARYIKINITKLPLSTWASIREFKVFAADN